MKHSDKRSTHTMLVDIRCRGWAGARFFAFVLASALLFWMIAIAQAGETNDPYAYIRANRLGITHISSVGNSQADFRYHQALTLGAGWNRWPLYWHWVETRPDEWDWRGYDQQIINDLQHGLNINLILMGTPEFHKDGLIMAGLHAPIYTDGTDLPGAGKTLNPQNPWVNYVHKAVSRYKPGGALAQAGQLPPGAGVRVWEIWNEPDFRLFWQGTVRDYARLLKISYIVIKSLDPQAQVMFGGLLYGTLENWLARVLSIYRQDADAARFNYYMDIVAIHSYADPWRSGWLALYVRETLRQYDLQRPIWLNETGVPVWDDYPGPLWHASSPNRSTTQQQAWFFIQSSVYAWSEGVDKVFYHQLYDDCGDQPAGTDFPLHMGELCHHEALCAGDAHGIYRNLSDSDCFSQHPQPGTPRPVAQAYRLMAEVFGQQAFHNPKRLDLDTRVVSFAFERPATGERIVVLWNRTFEGALVEVPALGRNAQLISLDGSALILPGDGGGYALSLPPALADNVATPPRNADAAIGGPPFFLIERIGGMVEVVQLGLDLIEEAPPTRIPATPTPAPTIGPALDLATDTQAPIARVLPLPPLSGPVFTVTWEGQDNIGIDRYLIWVRVDGGAWTPWIETRQTSAEYIAAPGTYEFAAWAVDLAGNWSTNTDLSPQAITQVE